MRSVSPYRVPGERPAAVVEPPPLSAAPTAGDDDDDIEAEATAVACADDAHDDSVRVPDGLALAIIGAMALALVVLLLTGPH